MQIFYSQEGVKGVMIAEIYNMRIKVNTLKKIALMALIAIILGLTAISILSANQPPQIVYKEVPKIVYEEAQQKQTIVDCGLYQSLVNMHNELRRAQNLTELKCGDVVMLSALKKNAYLVEHECFAHECTPDGNPFYFLPIKPYTNDSNSQSGFVGENLAERYKTEEDMMKAFVNSPSHYENIMMPSFNYIGISKLYRPDGSTVYTFHFSE